MKPLAAHVTFARLSSFFRSISGSADGTQVVIALSVADLNAIKLAESLAVVDENSVYLTVRDCLPSAFGCPRNLALLLPLVAHADWFLFVLLCGGVAPPDGLGDKPVPLCCDGARG